MSTVKTFKLSELAEYLNAQLEGDSSKEINGIASLSSATSSQISFIARESFIKELNASQAGAVICSKELSEEFDGNKLICENPYAIYAKCTKLFKEDLNLNKGVSEHAFVANSASVSESASVANFVTISEDVVIAEDVTIMPGTFIGKGCKIGKGTILYANCSLYDSVEIGANCIIHSGVVLGSDGLGFAKENGKWVKIEHLGSVIIGDDVEIGSNSTIDRGSVGDTSISENVKIDNQVHIAHNVSIGAGTAIAGNSAVAGSTIIGKNCTLAGCTAVVDNIELTDEDHVTASSLITKSIKESGLYSSGTPFMKNADWKKNAVLFKKLNKLTKN